MLYSDSLALSARELKFITAIQVATVNSSSDGLIKSRISRNHIDCCDTSRAVTIQSPPDFTRKSEAIPLRRLHGVFALEISGPQRHGQTRNVSWKLIPLGGMRISQSAWRCY